MIALESQKIAYTATPKVACSTIKFALAEIEGKSDLLIGDGKTPHKLVHGLYQTRRFRQEKWNVLENYWRFTVVRDPLSRLLSAYQNRVQRLGVLKNSRKVRNGWEGLTVDPDPDFFFQNLQKYRDASSDVKHHILPANLFVGVKSENYDVIYPIEEMKLLEADLSEISGVKIEFKRFKMSDEKISLDDLKPETRDALKKRLDPLYKNQIWDFENPFS